MRRRLSSIAALLVGGCTLAGCQAGSEDADVAHDGAGKARPSAITPGVPLGGPDVLYAAPPDLPQLQNRDVRFRAPVEMVSGTERYMDGEYQYSDFLYDDQSTTYPADFERYANNAGDLVEFRVSTRSDSGLGVRFLLNTLMVPDSTIIAVAFDSDANPDTGSSTLPRDPGMPFAGTDEVLTTWGTGAEWSRWTGSAWDTVPLQVHADTEANQITVTVPKSVANPSGQWRATLATGLYDQNTGGWRDLSQPTVAGPVSVPPTSAKPRIINLGFRFNEVAPAPPRAESAEAAPNTRQDEALAASEPTRFAHLIDFDLLRSGGERDNVPKRGMMYRMFASRMKTVMVSTDGTPANGNPRQLGEGHDTTSLHGRYLSPLQPYALYVPSGYDPARPAPMTFSLHGDGGEYYWLNDDRILENDSLGGNFAVKLFGEGRNSIVLSPSGRGKSGFYVGHHEYDLFEAWNDVARHFALDPNRTAVTGYSMGGHGSYRLALLWPHLFARAVPMAPAACRGLWYIASCSTTEDTVLARWTENARNLPIFHIADMFSELTFYPGQAQLAIGPAVNGLNSLDSLGYRYRFWSVAQDHILTGTNHPQAAEFLGQHLIEPEPFHVTYARMPSTDLPEIGLVHDRTYWLSGIELRDASDPLAKGVIDAVSLGFGKSDPTSSQSFAPGVTAAGWAYAETQRVWSEPGTVPVENRIVIKARNIASVTIDPAAARIDCNAKLETHSDGPIEIKLRGCAQPNVEIPYTPKGPIERKYMAPGPWAVTQATTVEACNRNLTACDLYYPSELGSNPLLGMASSFRHPVISWANGSGQLSAQYAYFLRHLASWGFVVVAAREMHTLDGATTTDAANYIIGQGRTPGSVFDGKVDGDRVGAAGHSQGGGSVIALFTDQSEPFTAYLPIHPAPHFFSFGVNGIISPCILFETCDARPFAGDFGNVRGGSILYLNSIGDGGYEDTQMYYDETPDAATKAYGVVVHTRHDDIMGTPACRDYFNCTTGVYAYLGYPTAWFMWKLQDAADGPQAFQAQTGEFNQPSPEWERNMSNVR